MLGLRAVEHFQERHLGVNGRIAAVADGAVGAFAGPPRDLHPLLAAHLDQRVHRVQHLTKSERGKTPCHLRPRLVLAC